MFKRTNSSRLDHVADGESLDRLVLRSATSAVGAADGLDVAAALLVAAAVEEKNMSVCRPPIPEFQFCSRRSPRNWRP